MIPTFILFKLLGWVDSLRPLTVPYWFGGAAFYTFLFRQFYRTIPLDLDEAAKIDGCGFFGIYWRITVTLGLRLFQEQGTMAQGRLVEWNLLMAASLVTMLVPLAVFAFAQRYFVRGIVTSGLKG